MACACATEAAINTEPMRAKAERIRRSGATDFMGNTGATLSTERAAEQRGDYAPKPAILPM